MIHPATDGLLMPSPVPRTPGSAPLTLDLMHRRALGGHHVANTQRLGEARTAEVKNVAAAGCPASDVVDTKKRSDPDDAAGDPGA